MRHSAKARAVKIMNLRRFLFAQFLQYLAGALNLVRVHKSTQVKGVNTYKLDGMMLPDPRVLDAQELRMLFLKLTEEFSERLSRCKSSSEIMELQELQNYIRLITTEIEIKDRKVLADLMHQNTAAPNLPGTRVSLD